MTQLREVTEKNNTNRVETERREVICQKRFLRCQGKNSGNSTRKLMKAEEHHLQIKCRRSSLRELPFQMRWQYCFFGI